MEHASGVEQEAGASRFWDSSVFSLLDVEIDLDLRLDPQNGPHFAEHQGNHDLSSTQARRRLPGHAVLSRVSALIHTSRAQNVDCLACQDTYKSVACFHAPCGHHFCPDCTVGMAEAAIAEGNEMLFPLRCCNKPLPPQKFLKPLPKPLRTSVAEKIEEMSVPGSQRLYCTNESCETFLGRSGWRKKVVSCPRCHTEVCSECKRTSHAPKPCGSVEFARQARGYAYTQGWKVCPGCSVVVERRDGCSHMLCRCGTRFCYRCGRRQRWCLCRFF